MYTIWLVRFGECIRCHSNEGQWLALAATYPPVVTYQPLRLSSRKSMAHLMLRANAI